MTALIPHPLPPFLSSLSFSPCLSLSVSVSLSWTCVLWLGAALACSRLWDRPIVWGAGSTPPARHHSPSSQKGEPAPATALNLAKLQSHAPPFVLGQQWPRAFLQVRTTRCCQSDHSGCTSLMSVIDGHFFPPTLSPLRALIKKKVQDEINESQDSQGILLQGSGLVSCSNKFSLAPANCLSLQIWQIINLSPLSFLSSRAFYLFMSPKCRSNTFCEISSRFMLLYCVLVNKAGKKMD